MITAIFFVAGAMAVAGALGIVLLKNPISSVLSLVLVMFALSVLFLVLSAQFLFAAQIIVYAGAVMVLFLFVIALLGPVRELATERLPRQWWLAVLVAAGFGVLLVSLLSNLRLRVPEGAPPNLFGSVEGIAFG
ncbi:MAG: NADH-quinone oxidoreductase subunit J, partial [Candidatus Dormibacteraeota bacterium]|nr:NADH-quinone oxidoreductase subunit J [Candidatus Dormibacteraeota bacterium]